MRRFGTARSSYRVEFALSVKPLMAELSPELADRISREVHALAELAELAPIPMVGGFTEAHDAPPLHLTVADWIITYVIDRRGRTVRVIALEPA